MKGTKEDIKLLKDELSDLSGLLRMLENGYTDYLKNKIVDIHLQIHANPDPRVQRQIAKPIGEWRLKDIANEIG